MAWRGDLNDMRDMSVTNLLKSIMDRTKEQMGMMNTVSDLFTKMQRVFLLTKDANLIMSVISRIMDEKSVLQAAVVTAGDKNAMVFLINKANILTNQLIRPKPRVLRTKQLFNKFRHAWRYAVGLHMAMWEEVIQANTISIIKDVPVIRSGAPNAKQSFVQKVRDAMLAGREPEDENDKETTNE
jgi:hypothetical protein